MRGTSRPGTADAEERVGRHSTASSWMSVTSMSSPATGRDERAESRAKRYGM